MATVCVVLAYGAILLFADPVFADPVFADPIFPDRNPELARLSVDMVMDEAQVVPLGDGALHAEAADQADSRLDEAASDLSRTLRQAARTF